VAVERRLLPECGYGRISRNLPESYFSRLWQSRARATETQDIEFRFPRDRIARQYPDRRKIRAGGMAAVVVADPLAVYVLPIPFETEEAARMNQSLHLIARLLFHARGVHWLR
jgi:hypothetical protein